MAISIPLVAIIGMVVLVTRRYAGLKAWQALVCLLAGFLLSATSAARLAVHHSRHDIADTTPPVRRSRACQQTRRAGSPQHTA